MSEDLTPRQQILLWDLISRGGSALQKDLKPEVKPADREPLVKAKMISAVKTPTRAIELTVEEGGWNHLATTAPTLSKSEGSKYDRPILQFVLAKVQAYASANPPLTYADMFAGRAEEHSRDPTSSDPAPGVTLLPIETTIRSAFFDIAGRPARNQVRLRQLRDRLSSIPRSLLDEALISMREAQRARFSTLSNPPDIAEEGDAALRIKNVDYHTIWIDP